MGWVGWAPKTVWSLGLNSGPKKKEFRTQEEVPYIRIFLIRSQRHSNEGNMTSQKLHP